MYLRRCYRAKDGKRHAYWALVKSVRTAKGPRQEVVAYLGDLDEAGRLGVQQAAGPLCSGSSRQGKMFEEPGAVQPRWVEVDFAGVRVDGTRDFGGPWLALQLLGKLKLKTLLDGLMPAGREDVPWSIMSLVLVICRLCDPSSELRIAEHLYEQSALSDLLGVGAEKINDDRLYRALDALLPHKTELEKHLKQRLGELFDLKYDLLLYDMTSTYFEGQCAAMGQPQRRLLPAAQQRQGVVGGGPVAGLYATHRSRGGVPHPQKRPVAASGLAPEKRAGAGPRAGLLPGLRAVQDVGANVQVLRPGGRATQGAGRDRGGANSGRDSTHTLRPRDPQTMRRQAHRASGDPLAQARNELAEKSGDRRFVVKTFRKNRPWRYRQGRFDHRTAEVGLATFSSTPGACAAAV